MCLDVGLVCPEGDPFQVCTDVPGELVALHARGLLPTHRDLDDLVKHDIRRDMEVEDEVLEGGRARPAVTGGQQLTAWGSTRPLPPGSACLHPGHFP